MLGRRWIIKIKNSDNLRECPEGLSKTCFRVSVWDVTKPNNTFTPKQKIVALLHVCAFSRQS